MSLFVIPASVSSHLKKIIKDFVWSYNVFISGFLSINWREVYSLCCSKEEGGLGVRPLWYLNEALKIKWLCILLKRKLLFGGMLIVKYGVDICWIFPSPMGSGDYG